ncbi:MAG: type II secretion system protein M [Candidatus Wallbacteria bacterium]|nr:type II secretion system protein M [Candidatus Wallbacteria bacterium]
MVGNLELTRRQAALGLGILAGVYVYFSLIVGPQSERIATLRAEVEKQGRQAKAAEELRVLNAECDKLTGSGQSDAQSIEARVEKVGRELGLAPTIRKLSESSATEPNKVEVRLGNLYLREMVEFLSRIEKFPVTVQVVRFEINKQGSMAGVALILSDLTL